MDKNIHKGNGSAEKSRSNDNDSDPLDDRKGKVAREQMLRRERAMSGRHANVQGRHRATKSHRTIKCAASSLEDEYMQQYSDG